MNDNTLQSLPVYLRKYIVPQDQSKYTPLDQAVWRYILRQLRSYLGIHAHETYLWGLEQSGISTEEIPHISEISQHLSRFGWKALPVSGFIPPSAFMELQSLGVLPIASDMRTLEHLLYTPAPDIVHEAAGHAPLLTNLEYSNYLRQYAQVAKKALISKEDLNVYQAIRELSDIKENPSSTPTEIQDAEKKLEAANQAVTHTSEAALLSRMNWWTAEYGLIGDLKSPKIIGAGLLSSVGESELCLSPQVKKIPLSLDCIQYSYDITEPQPQLFVANSFSHLKEVLNQMSRTMAYQIGGTQGVAKAIEAETVNTVELDTGIQIGGVCKSQVVNGQGEIVYLNFEGPCQLAFQNQELTEQGTAQHAHGFGTPVGAPHGLEHDDLSFENFSKLQKGNQFHLQYPSGLEVTGDYKSHVEQNGSLILLSLENAKATLNGSVLFDPSWGTYDMAIGTRVVSVYAGAPDHIAYGETDDFHAKVIPQKSLSPAEIKRGAHYLQLRQTRHQLEMMRENSTLTQHQQISSVLQNLDLVCQQHQAEFSQDWLWFLELYEICFSLTKTVSSETATTMTQQLSQILQNLSGDPKTKKLIQDGLREIHQNPLFLRKTTGPEAAKHH